MNGLHDAARFWCAWSGLACIGIFFICAWYEAAGRMDDAGRKTRNVLFFPLFLVWMVSLAVVVSTR